MLNFLVRLHLHKVLMQKKDDMNKLFQLLLTSIFPAEIFPQRLLMGEALPKNIPRQKAI